MKNYLLLFLSFLFANALNAQELHLPFYDDFSNDYENWTSYSITGDDQWHLSGDDGIDGGKCARFYITTNPPQINDDWLVSKIINTEGVSNIAIKFKFWYHGEGMKPEFYYTTSFTGDVSTTSWTELDNSFWKNDWTWNNARIEIENPGNTLVFAIRYQSTTENSEYVLIDNFSMNEFEPVIYEKVGTSEHFEFYTNISNAGDYWKEIQEGLEGNYQKYCGIWNVGGKSDFIDKNAKTKIYYTEKANIPFADEGTPETKSGFFDRETKTIYLSPIDTPEKQEYYVSMEGLAINTFAGYAKRHQLFRDQNGYDELPDYYTEGFGLYEQGFRPRMDSIISFRSKHPDDLTHNDLDAMNIFSRTSQMDIIVSYVEAQIVCLLDYYGTAPYGSFTPIWNNYLVYFYDTTDVVRIEKYASSENFDIYCSSRDTMFIDSFFVWLERPRQFYTDSFQLEVNRKFNLVIYYDEKTGMDMTGYDNWNGGAGGLNISPHNFFGGYDGYKWLLGHEFGHVFNSLMYCDMPTGFYHEGMANFSGYKVAGGEHRDDRWKIDYVFNYYQNTYNRTPTLEEIITNPDAGKPGLEWGIDCYFFGFEFFRFLRKNEGYTKIKEFFVNEMDFNVFTESYDELEQGYIDYLKYLKNADQNYPELNTNNGIVIEQGSTAVITVNNLSISDQEAADDRLFLEIISNPNNGHIAKINDPDNPITKFSEQEIKQEQIIYVNDNTSATSDFFIFSITDEIFGTGDFRFDITLTAPTGISKLSRNQNDFNIYPNPVTRESIISFQTKTSGNVNLSIFDIQGRKVCTLLNEKLNAGMHTIPLENHLKSGGVYLCKLATSERVSTLKLVVKE